jgi:nicotinamidase-related amidase
MDLNEIDLKKTAILFFDMLNGYCYGENQKVKPQFQPMVDNAVRLMKAGRETGIAIVFAKGNHRADGSLKGAGLVLSDTDYGRPWPDGVVKARKPTVVEGAWSSGVIAELEARPEDYYITKHRWSAFHQTHLDLALRSLGLNTVIISGASTYIGVAPTVYDGRDLGYNFIVVRDACTAANQQAHDVMMDIIFPCLARVRTTDQVLDMIQCAKNKS